MVFTPKSAGAEVTPIFKKICSWAHRFFCFRRKAAIAPVFEISSPVPFNPQQIISSEPEMPDSAQEMSFVRSIDTAQQAIHNEGMRIRDVCENICSAEVTVPNESTR